MPLRLRSDADHPGQTELDSDHVLSRAAAPASVRARRRDVLEQSYCVSLLLTHACLRGLAQPQAAARAPKKPLA